MDQDRVQTHSEPGGAAATAIDFTTLSFEELIEIRETKLEGWIGYLPADEKANVVAFVDAIGVRVSGTWPSTVDHDDATL